MRLRTSALGIGLLALLGLAACSDDEGPRRDVFFGALRSADDGRRLAPARLALFDVDRAIVVALTTVVALWLLTALAAVTVAV